jgi:hypothetical protein
MQNEGITYDQSHPKWDKIKNVMLMALDILFKLIKYPAPVIIGICILAKAGVFHALTLVIRLSVGISLLALPFLIFGSSKLYNKIPKTCCSCKEKDSVNQNGVDPEKYFIQHENHPALGQGM